MHGFIKCSIYVITLAILSFPFGRLLALIPFDVDKFPFKEHSFEKKFYKFIKITKWKDHVPDMSKVFPKILPRKTVSSANNLSVIIKETCVAETVHVILCILAIALPFLWPEAGGIFFLLIYILLGNVPFILIQRYNRPRFCRMNTKVQQRKERSV